MCSYLDKVGSIYYFRRAVPLELRPFILTRSGKPRTEWKWSLGTKDQTEAKRLLPAHTVQTDAAVDRARDRLAGGGVEDASGKPVQRVSARAGRFMQARDDAMHEAALWAEQEADGKEARREDVADLMEFLRERLKGSTKEMPRRLRAIAYLMEEGEMSRPVVKEQYAIAKEQKRVLDMEPVAAPASGPALPLLELFDDYAKEQGMKPVSAQDWKGVLRALVRFLGHDDMAKLTVDDVDRWRDFLLSETTKRGALRSPRTVKNKYISALRSTLNYAVSKRKLTENVALKVVVRLPRQSRLRERDFTSAEAKSILSATMQTHARATPLMQRAYRWIPWICAYTGARVNEISQLRGEDVVETDGIWTIRITPEAGTVKSGEARTVPLHPHLIEQGLVEFVRKAGDGPLFYDPSRLRKPSPTNRYVSKVGEKLAAWVRAKGGVSDPNVPPNHGWRHLFKTRALDAGMPERIADAIQGHAPRSIGQTYGRVSLQAMNDALVKLPRFSVD